MSDGEPDLLATTDATVWATQWCRIARQIEAADDGRKVIDEGWMVGWFANAMGAQERADRTSVTTDPDHEGIDPVTDDDPQPDLVIGYQLEGDEVIVDLQLPTFQELSLVTQLGMLDYARHQLWWLADQDHNDG